MSHQRNFFQQLYLLILIGMVTACSGIVEVVPFSSSPLPFPTSLPASTSAPTELPPATKDNLPFHIVAETIKLDAPVTEMGWSAKEEWGKSVIEWDIPFSEAGWHRNSARLGEKGNIVISGHNNSMGGRVFANLEQLAVGDKITLWDKHDHFFVYQVSEKNIVRALWASPETEKYLQTVMESTDTAQLTLITCWPSWSNTHRLVVIAKPF